MTKLFSTEQGDFSWKGMNIDKVVTFYDNSGNIEGEYFYFNECCNYLLSYGFNKGSLGELRKKQSNKKKLPFFSLAKGWYGYG